MLPFGATIRSTSALAFTSTGISKEASAMPPTICLFFVGNKGRVGALSCFCRHVPR